MALFIIRVELRGTPSRDNYNSLHAYMTGQGWSRTISGVGDAGVAKTVNLPHAVYQGEATPNSPMGLATALKEAIETRVWKDCIVMAVEAENWGLSE
jgi:hypothetical protein